MKKRLAKEHATGRRYIVQRIEFPRDGRAKVHCWGEVIRITPRGGTVHASSLVFTRADVDVEEVEASIELNQELFEQTRKRLIDDGAILRGGKRDQWVDHEHYVKLFK